MGNGDTPCIRFCDNKPSDNETKRLKKTFGEEIQFDQASSMEQSKKNCPDGQSRTNICAKKTCKHSFELIKDKGEIKLKIIQWGNAECRQVLFDQI